MEYIKRDQPVDLKSDDKFQRYTFAERIAKIILSKNQPSALVIGIYGKWGEGKTSILNFIRHEVTQEKTVVVDFNPWRFSDENQLLLAFFSTIALILKKQLKTRTERAAEFLTAYGDNIGTVSNAVKPGSGILWGMLGKVAEKLQKNSVEDLKKRVDNLIVEAGCKFVVFIDDIDRLNVNEVQAVFRLVKLLGDFPNTSYVLSFDDEMVAAALGPMYGKGDGDSGREFLEKIIQVPLHLPKANKQALQKYCFDLVNEVFAELKINIDQKDADNFVRKFNQAILPVLTNPRSAIRFSNSIAFSIPLLVGECNITDLLIIESLKIYFPSLYYFIRQNPDHFIRNFTNYGNTISNISNDEKERVRKRIQEEVDQYGQNATALLNLVLDIFPQLQGVFRNVSYSVETMQQWYREMRICSGHHFERYFSYVVKDGDISDAYFKELLGWLNETDIDAIKKHFETELPKMGPEDFLFKLKNFLVTLSGVQAKNLAVILGTFATFFPESNQIISFSGRSELPYIIFELLKQIQPSRRKDICAEILQSAEPFEFTAELYRKFSTRDHKIEEGLFLQNEELLDLEKIIVERFKSLYKSKEAFSNLSDGALVSYFDMFKDTSNPEFVRTLLADELQETCGTLRIIKIFTPSARSSARPTPDFYKAGFSLSTYSHIAEFIDVQLLYEKTLEVYGKIEYKPVNDPTYGELTDENLIAIFQKTHEEVSAKNFTD